MRFLLVLLPLLLPAASIEVTLDPALAPKGTSGRLIVLMKQGKPQGDTIRTGFIPGETWMAAKEVEHFAPGSTVTVDGDDIAFPRPFSQAPAGEWHYMAILDVDHSYARNGAGPGDLVSAIATGPKLTLSRVNPPRPAPADTDTVKLVEFESKLLSNFFGRPVKMRAGVLLPADFAKPGAAYPAIYHVHGFGGDHTAAWRAKPATAFRAVHIFLDASCPGGHHVFADSANNGPWGAALTKEFIPYLEKRFRLLPRPYARFLTGHSSGGWSTLWLQVAYPRFFGGTWPTAPDSVDFESFTGIDVRPGSTQNAYLTKEGQPLYLVRLKGKDVVTLRDFALQERVAGDYGGQFASFDWVFSPKGLDGRPMRLFNRVTGEVDPAVREYWRKYDISYQVQTRWAELGPLLKGKIRLVMGDQDTFHLDEATKLFCKFLASKGAEDACEIVPERDHGDLFKPYKTYPDGLMKRIEDEMAWQFEKGRPKAK
jgi:hypothetical protein